MATPVAPQSISSDALYWSRERSLCEKDLDYLCKTYLHIKAKQVIGFPTMHPNRPQRVLLDAMRDQLKRTGRIRQVWGKARSIGASSLVRGLSFQQTAFRKNRNAILMAHDEPSSLELFDVDKTFYDALPAPLQAFSRYRAKARMTFDTLNSKILVGHALNLHVGASQMHHIVHLTEAARYRNGSDVQASLFPAISDAVGEDFSAVVIESTSLYGGDWFKEFAESAQRGENGYEFHFVPYFMHEEYRTPVPKGFRPDAEEQDLMRRYQLPLENIVWRRVKRAGYLRNLAHFAQQYPCSWEESWQLPEGTLRVFTDEMLEPLAAEGQICPGRRMTPTSAGLVAELGGPLEVWSEPVPGVFYDLGVDPAEGRTRGADWTAVSVVRRDTLEQVGEMHLHMDPASEEFINLVYWLGMAYNTAQINPDITGGWGAALMSQLQRRDYPAIWQWRRRDDVMERVSKRLGFYYTRRDKVHLVNNGVLLVTRGQVVIHSEGLLEEMRTFLNIGLDEWGAASGTHDDRVNGWMLALLSARDEWREDWKPSDAEVAVAVSRDPPPVWKRHDVDTDLLPEPVSALRLEPWRVG